MIRDATDERALVARANRGDADAFEALYRLHRDWVVALARRFTGDRDDALDALQETFVHLFGRFPGFTLTSTLRAYLYPVVRHVCISLARKRRRVVPLQAALEAGREPAVEPVEPEWSPVYARRIAALPEGQREVLRLRFALEMRLDEIAHALDVPLGTVKSRLHNALRALGENA